MRLIDADALVESMGLESAVKWGNKDRHQQDQSYSTMMLYEIKNAIDCQPTVDVLQKLWNALYAEEDKFEKRHIGTSEHDNWFLIYRPWLQSGFEIAIKVLSELFIPEPPKEDA